MIKLALSLWPFPVILSEAQYLEGLRAFRAHPDSHFAVFEALRASGVKVRGGPREPKYPASQAATCIREGMGPIA